MTTTARSADVARDTAETRIRVRLNLDGSGKAQIDSGIGFYDHMLHHVAHHGLFDGLGTVGVRGHPQPAAMGLVDDGAQLVERIVLGAR